MSLLRRSLIVGFGAGLSLILTGCSVMSTPMSLTAAPSVAGNWQVSSTVAAASKLPSFSGELAGTASAVTGMLHASPAATCVAASALIPVTGSTDAKGVLTLAGKVAGGTLSVTGLVAADGKSLTEATYGVSGGTCDLGARVAANAQAYSSVTGTYAGNFSDAQGQVIGLTANLVQTPSASNDGNFTLSGTGTLGNNACFSNPVSVSNSQVTGGTFTLTYSDAVTMNSVTATGTFSPDASTLTVSSWTLSGFCGPDAGTGLLVRQ